MKLLFLALAACASSTKTKAPEPPPPHAFHVEVSGQGPAVVLVPGLSSSGDTWTTTVAHLRERYTCHVLTLAGFAGVPPIDGALGTTVETELARYITSHQLGKPVIIGHSLGGGLAVTLTGGIVVEMSRRQARKFQSATRL